MQNILRWITRPWSKANIDLTSAESEQEQGSSGQAVPKAVVQPWHSSVSRSTFQGDACADGGCSSKGEDRLRKARGGKKPWDPPFRSQLPRTELVGKSSGGRLQAVTDTSPPRKTGRDLEARFLATRLFPPDPVLEMDDGSEYNQRSVMSSGTYINSQEPLHRQSPPKNQSPSLDNKGGESSREQQSKPPLASSIPPQRTHPGSLPSPLDGSPLPFMCHLSRTAPHTTTREPSRCLCRLCRHSRSEPSVPQSPAIPLIAPKECSPFEGDMTCHTCHCYAPQNSPPTKGREIAVPCSYPDSAPADSHSKSFPARYDTKGAPRETSKDAPKEVVKGNPKEAPKASSKTPKASPPLWQVLLVTMGFIIFLFAFAILVAHCLALFLVYKTEARLGEVRNGLLRGGEMKLCLCGRS